MLAPLAIRPVKDLASFGLKWKTQGYKILLWYIYP